ncbi:MAG: MSMEG_6728 family protein [Methanogenium sp.]|jgi:hypothetical protein
MNTFLPFTDFAESAAVLDNKRLGKQRVETYQILRVLLNITESKAWRNHPAVKMWKNHEGCLIEYGIAICTEWRKRGFKDTCLDKINALRKYVMSESYVKPEWLGNENLHLAYKSNLLRKDFNYYKQYNWPCDNNLSYIWPVK